MTPETPDPPPVSPVAPEPPTEKVLRAEITRLKDAIRSHSIAHKEAAMALLFESLSPSEHASVVNSAPAGEPAVWRPKAYQACDECSFQTVCDREQRCAMDEASARKVKL